MSHVSSYSSVLGVDIEDLSSYSSDELETLVGEKLVDMSESERSEFLEELNTELEEMRDSLDDLQNGTEDVLDDAEDEDDFESAAKAEMLMDDLEEVISTLDEVEDAADDALQYYEFTNVSTSEDYNVTYDSSEFDTIKDGDTIHVEATGGADSGIFSNGTTDGSGDVVAGTQQVDTNADGALDTLVDANQDGVADADFNGDGFINYTDLTFGLESTNPAEAGQNIFIDVNPGDTIAWPPAYNAQTDTVSLVVTTAEGKTFTIEVAGDANLIFSGSNYISGLSGGDFSFLASADPELLKRCYDGTGDSMSFYDHIYPDEVTADERRGAIPGYNESVEGISSTIATMEDYLATSTADKDSLALALPADADAVLTEMLNALYDTDLIAGTSTDTLTVEDSWAAIMEIISAYPPEQQAALMSAFVMDLAANDPTNFKNLLGSKITSIEAIVCYAEYDASEDTNIGSFEKFIVTLMEMQSGGVGTYGGTAMMTNGLAYALEDGTEGAWKNQGENMQALEWYNSFLSTMGVGADATALDALGREQDMQANATDGNKLNDTLTVSEEEASDLASTMMSYVDGADSTENWGQMTGISKDEYTTEMTTLIGNFTTWMTQGLTVQQLIDKIKSEINTLDSAHRNDILSAFIYALDQAEKKNGLTIAGDLLADKSFNNWCSTTIEFNVNAEPTYYKEALDVLQKHNTSADSYANKAEDNKQVNLGNESNDYDSEEAKDKEKDDGFIDKAEDVVEDFFDIF